MPRPATKSCKCRNFNLDQISGNYTLSKCFFSDAAGTRHLNVSADWFSFSIGLCHRVIPLLGHKSIRMTLCYVQVTPNDLHQQYHQARRNIASKYLLAKLPAAQTVQTTGNSGMLALRNALAAAQHLLAHFRLQLSDPAARNKLARLANRLVKISTELAQF
jgi:hypothetical protein